MSNPTGKARSKQRGSGDPTPVEAADTSTLRDSKARYPYHCPYPHCPREDGACQRKLCKELLSTRCGQLYQEFFRTYACYDSLYSKCMTLIQDIRNKWPGVEDGDFHNEYISVRQPTTDEVQSCCLSCFEKCTRLCLHGLRARVALDMESCKDLKEYIKVREEGEEAEKTYTESNAQDEREVEVEVEGEEQWIDEVPTREYLATSTYHSTGFARTQSHRHRASALKPAGRRPNSNQPQAGTHTPSTGTKGKRPALGR